MQAQLSSYQRNMTKEWISIMEVKVNQLYAGVHQLSASSESSLLQEQIASFADAFHDLILALCHLMGFIVLAQALTKACLVRGSARRGALCALRSYPQ